MIVLSDMQRCKLIAIEENTVQEEQAVSCRFGALIPRRNVPVCFPRDTWRWTDGSTQSGGEDSDWIEYLGMRGCGAALEAMGL